MKISTIMAWFSIPLLVVAFNLFSSAVRVASSLDEPVDRDFDHKIDPTSLLETRSYKSEIYTKAMIELKRLEEEPFCHRLAAQLLMNNCRDVKDMSDEDSQLKIAQTHHVESFANGLTLCDLARGKFSISEACSPFTSSALLRVYYNGKGKLEVSPQQITACIEALAKDHSQWLTWVKHRDNSLMFCRAVRLDIDKDETILLHKELTRLMSELAEGLKVDLACLRKTMAEHSSAMDSYFQEVMAHTELLKSKAQGSIVSLSNEVQHIGSTINSILGSSSDLKRMLKVLIDTVIQSNAEIAAEQEHALAATTDLANSRLTGVNVLAEETYTTMNRLNSAIDQLMPGVISLAERQDAMDQRSEALYAALGSMINIINNHSEILEQASFTAKGISASLENAAAVARSLNETLNLSGPLGDWALRFCIPLSSVFIGSYGLPPTPVRNAFLLLFGYISAEGLVLFRKSNWADFSFGSSTPSSVTHLARENILSSLSLTPTASTYEFLALEVDLM